MTNHEINRVIAESLGWKSVMVNGTTPAWITHLGSYISDLPDFTDSLDACRLFEETITREADLHAYGQGICIIGRFKFSINSSAIVATKLATMLPIQRCEAYLRMKGLWKEDK